MDVSAQRNDGISFEDSMLSLSVSVGRLEKAFKSDGKDADPAIEDALRAPIEKAFAVSEAVRCMFVDTFNLAIGVMTHTMEEAVEETKVVIGDAREKEFRVLQREWTDRINAEERSIIDRATARLARLEVDRVALAAEYGDDAANDAIGSLRASITSAMNDELAAFSAKKMKGFAEESEEIERRAEDRVSDIESRASEAIERANVMVSKLGAVLADFDALDDALAADDGVDEFLDSGEIFRGGDVFMPMQDFKRELKKFEEERGLRKRPRNTDKLRIALAKRGLKVSKTKKRYGNAELFRDYIKGIDRVQKL